MQLPLGPNGNNVRTIKKTTCFNLEIKLIILLLNFVSIVLAKNIITATVLFYCEAKIFKIE